MSILSKPVIFSVIYTPLPFLYLAFSLSPPQTKQRQSFTYSCTLTTHTPAPIPYSLLSSIKFAYLHAALPVVPLSSLRPKAFSPSSFLFLPHVNAFVLLAHYLDIKVWMRNTFKYFALSAKTMCMTTTLSS